VRTSDATSTADGLQNWQARATGPGLQGTDTVIDVREQACPTEPL